MHGFCEVSKAFIFSIVDPKGLYKHQPQFAKIIEVAGRFE